MNSTSDAPKQNTRRCNGQDRLAQLGTPSVIADMIRPDLPTTRRPSTHAPGPPPPLNIPASHRFFFWCFSGVYVFLVYIKTWFLVYKHFWGVYTKTGVFGFWCISIFGVYTPEFCPQAKAPRKMQEVGCLGSACFWCIIIFWVYTPKRGLFFGV